MEFQKIQLTKQKTLTVVYKNADGDVITFVGANIVHRDLRDAVRALVPHLAIITEQREVYNRTLKDILRDKISDGDNKDNIYMRLDVDGLTFNNNEREVAVSGQRILTTAGVVKLQTPQIDVEDADQYEHAAELSLALDAVKYEAKAYLEDRKWGVKEAEIAFEDIDPFNGVQADEVPIAEAQEKPKKRGRKAKAA